MSRVLTIARAVIRDAIRRKVVWVVVVFAALLSIVAPNLPSYGVGVVSAVYREITVALMFAASLVVTIALAATRIPVETERRTVFTVLARDVSRWHYVVGTWAGLCAVTGIAILAFGMAAIAVGALVYREVMWLLLAGALAVWLEMSVIAAATVMSSARLGVVTSAVFALAFAFAGHSVGGLVSGGGLPWFVPTLDVFDVVNPVAHGSGYGALYALGMIGSCAAMSGLLLLVACALFDGRDL